MASAQGAGVCWGGFTRLGVGMPRLMGEKRKCPDCGGPMTLLGLGRTGRPQEPLHVQPDHVHVHHRCEDPDCGVTYREDAPDSLGGGDNAG